MLLEPGVGRGEVVISADLDGLSVTENDVIVSAARIIKRSISEKFNSLDELEWPPNYLMNYLAEKENHRRRYCVFEGAADFCQKM